MRVYHDFFWYPDPDQRFLMRIRIRPNDTDPDPKHWLDKLIFTKLIKDEDQPPRKKSKKLKTSKELVKKYTNKDRCLNDIIVCSNLSWIKKQLSRYIRYIRYIEQDQEPEVT